MFKLLGRDLRLEQTSTILNPQHRGRGKALLQTCLSVALVAFTVTASHAQLPLNLGGAWMPVKGGAVPRMINIEITATGITLRETVRDEQIRDAHWRFGDASLSPAGNVAGNDYRTRALVEGGEIVFVGEVSLPAKTAAIRETWSLDPTGQLLTVRREIEYAPLSYFKNEETFQRSQ